MVVKPSIEELAWASIAVLLSAAVWLAFGGIMQALSPLVEYAPGIDLVYLPAGVRLGIILIFRSWGAVGIAVTNPLLFDDEFGVRSGYEVAINGIISGFVPLLTVVLALQFLAAGDNLEKLRPVHLLLFALAVSVATPLAFNVQFLSFGYKSADEFWENVSAMMLGDFMGCFVVLLMMRGAIYLYRCITRM